VGGLRKELDFGFKEENGWFKEGARPLFDVCGYGGLSVAMGLMRPTANRGPFLGCIGWIWVVYGKSVVWGRRLRLHFMGMVGL